MSNETTGRDSQEFGGKDDQLNLGDYLDAHRGERHIVVLQDYPDPDAISSALAYELIANKFDIETEIIYNGRISHQQNIALVKLLGIDLQQFQPEMDLSIYDGAVFVDNQGTTSADIVKALQRVGIPICIVIDHHEPQSRLEPEFLDIRRTGATATILAQYMRQGLVKMDPSRKEHVLVATALLHGIMTDTGDFIRARDEDFAAASFLSAYRDTELLAKIINQSRSRQVMEVIHQALVDRLVVESFSIAGIGYLRREDRDVIPQAADFLLTEENVHTAIVYGIIINDDTGEERVFGSIRTSKLTLDPDDFVKNVLGKDASGHYFGGGKITAAGFEIPVGFLSGGTVDGYRDLKWQVYDNQIKQKIFAKIGVAHPDRES